jgi:glycosyltransferase involved in cell wall biosynthesis
MRILQVNSSGTWGGGETHVQQLTEFLRERGHDVVIAGRPKGRLDPEIKLPFLNSADFITALRLRRELQKAGFDIVHAHLARDYTIVAAAAWGTSQPKLVFTRHLLLPIRSHFFCRRADAWIAPTAQILNTLAPPARNIGTVIPNWVDVRKFAFSPHHLHMPVTIGLIGQISPHKGQGDAIEAVRQLGGHFRLVIGGEGEPAYVESLKKEATGLPVEFLGFVPLPEAFQEIDILIMPSWEEPFGILLLEAMAAGIPVVATASGGPREIISAPTVGVLIPPHDPGALATAIQSLTSDDARRSSIVRNARARVEAIYDIRIVVPRIEGIYKQLTGK